ncbi:UNVERIFIED_CONTAM: hypothetical protein BEN50_07455, partial [Euhalothece sp. KZN 001]
DPATDLANAGVNPGDQFRLVFVTTGERDATSSNISDYNTFVDSDADNFNAEMNSLLGSVIQDDFGGNAASITYNAIGSTSSVDARDNTNTNPNTDGDGEPILLVDGNIVANDYDDLWDGSINYPINTNSDGVAETAQIPFTGTSSDGRADSSSDGLGTDSNLVEAGSSSLVSSNWVNFTVNRPTNNARFYGMSEPLTRAETTTAVPFHTDTLPGLIAMGGLIFWRYRRKKRKAD